MRLKHGYQKDTHDYHTKERDLDASNPVFLKGFNSNSSKSWQAGTRACTTGPASALAKLSDRLEVCHYLDHLWKKPHVTAQSPESASLVPDSAAPE